MPDSTIIITPAAAPLRGEITVPGDKSISHRAVMFGALAEGDTRIRGFLRGADCLSTIACFRQLGISIEEHAGEGSEEGKGEDAGEIIVHGKGLHGLLPADSVLDAGNSGTTVRLMSGILSGQRFDSVITGDASIQKRPMKRVIEPLRQMGASIRSKAENGCVPLCIGGRAGQGGRPLSGISYRSPVASAQVKSCILLAGLYADGETTVLEPALSRDHTERMLTGFGADVKTDVVPVSASASAKPLFSARILPAPCLHGMDITVPGDISSAAYFLAAALIIPGSELLIKGVGVNPTRDGIIRVARDMGGDINLLNRREVGGEPVADLLVRYSALHGIRVEGALIPTLIDELPIIAVMAACAQGTTVIADAAELKVKESDRILTICEGLKAMGVSVTPTQDGMIIEGNGPEKPLAGAVIDSHADHRIAMSFSVAGLAAQGETKIQGGRCVDISYPGFFQELYAIVQ